MQNRYQQYKDNSIATMSGGELVVVLYREAYKNLFKAGFLYDQGKNDEARIAGDKAKAIFSHLLKTLNFDYPISLQLQQYYNFFNQQIIYAQVKNNRKPIDDILGMVKELEETWAEAEKLIHVK